MNEGSRHQSTTHNPVYQELIRLMVKARVENEVTQIEVAKFTGLVQSHISQTENYQRRLDLLEALRYIDGATKGDKHKAKEIWNRLLDEYYKSKKRK